jgi:hypothetical protein
MENLGFIHWIVFMTVAASVSIIAIEIYVHWQPNKGYMTTYLIQEYRNLPLTTHYKERDWLRKFPFPKRKQLQQLPPNILIPNKQRYPRICESCTTCVHPYFANDIPNPFYSVSNQDTPMSWYHEHSSCPILSIIRQYHNIIEKSSVTI